MPMLEAAGAHVEGLRLDDGALILKVEAAGMAVQVRIADPPPLLAGGGDRLPVTAKPGGSVARPSARQAAARLLRSATAPSTGSGQALRVTLDRSEGGGIMPQARNARQAWPYKKPYKLHSQTGPPGYTICQLFKIQIHNNKLYKSCLAPSLQDIGAI